MGKNQEYNELFETVSQIYLKNINFLSKYYNTLHKRVLEFEKLNIETYFLEFVNNHFELIDNKNNHIYNCDPFFDAQARCKDIKDKPSFSQVSQSIFTNANMYEDEINAKAFLNEYLQEEKVDTNFKKFIFFGTLLGVHINDLHRVLNSKMYLIVEDSLEIFRLSLFLTDYEEIYKNSTLIFCIQEDEKTKKEIVKRFLDLNNQYNFKIGFEVANQFSLDNIDNLTKIFIDNDPLNYPFSEYLISFKRALHYFDRYKNSFIKLSQNYEILNKPVLFLGAGPSLAKNIEWIYLYQDYFLIVCAAGTLKRLELLGIVPNIILSVDGQKELVQKQFEVNEKYYKDSIIIASSKTDKQVLEKIYHKNLFFMPDSIEVFDANGVLTGVTVGDVGLQLILNLGAKEIYMLGFDAAISESGKTHDATHYTSKVKNEKANVIDNSGFNTSKDLIEVKGNFRDKVLTFMLYTQMIESINSITASLKDKTKLFNLSDGAYFEDFTPLKKENISSTLKCLDKDTLKDEILSSLNNITLTNISQKDISTFKIEKKVIKKLLNITDKNYITIFEKLKKQYQNSLFIQILDRFFRLTNPYKEQINKTIGTKIQFEQFKKVIEELNSSIETIL